MRPFLALLKPYRLQFAIAVVVLMLGSTFNAGLTAMIEPLMDKVLNQNPSGEAGKADSVLGLSEKMSAISDWLEKHGIVLSDVEEKAEANMTPMSWAVLAMLIFLGEAICDFLGTYLMGRIGVTVVVNMRRDIIDKVMGMSLSFFKEFNTGEILTRINSDVQRVQTAISVKLGDMVKETTRCIVFVILAFYLDWKLSLSLFILVPAIGIPIAILTRKIRKYAVKSQSFLGTLTAHFKEVLVAMRIVKGFQREEYESEVLADQNKSFFRYAIRELKIIALTRPIMSLIGMIYILAFINYGGIQIQAGNMSSGQFILYVLVINSLYHPIKRLARSNSEIQQAVGVLPRVLEIMEWDNEIKDTKNPQRPKNYPEVEQIRFEDVYFDYGNQAEPVLKGINLAIDAGSVVALVGASGSGKSSMVNLLPRFYDITKGRLTINGTDIRDMSKQDLRGLIAIVTQDTLLFDDTVHNNIAYGLPEVSRERVQAAAKQAFADGFINELANGYDTKIGENGGSLSGGQRQRLSIARAILKDAPILVLDEATSALDTESEHEVQMALDNLMKTRTTVVIAHRLSTVRRADSIVGLNEGQIVEQGTHEQLMAQDGMYRKLIQMQEEGKHAL